MGVFGGGRRVGRRVGLPARDGARPRRVDGRGLRRDRLRRCQERDDPRGRAGSGEIASAALRARTCVLSAVAPGSKTNAPGIPGSDRSSVT